MKVFLPTSIFQHFLHCLLYLGGILKNYRLYLVTRLLGFLQAFRDNGELDMFTRLTVPLMCLVIFLTFPVQAAPLRVHPVNPRYFADSGKVVYLTGSQTHANFQDWGYSDPPPRFDYNAYLNFLQAHNHNFI